MLACLQVRGPQTCRVGGPHARRTAAPTIPPSSVAAICCNSTQHDSNHIRNLMLASIGVNCVNTRGCLCHNCNVRKRSRDMELHSLSWPSIEEKSLNTVPH